MIPEFTESGFLPPGVHRASIDEFKQRFVIFDSSDQRVRLFERLEQLFADVKACEIVRHIILVGSFITKKAAPNDFDCILVIDSAILDGMLRPQEYNLVSRHAARRLYGGDVVPVIEGSQAHFEYLEFFQNTRDGQRVGVLEVEL